MFSGYYYLHTNGSLIYKRDLGGTAGDLAESTFVKKFWPCDPANRMHAWAIVTESLALGAEASRVKALAEKWGCDKKDMLEYLRRVKSPTDFQKRGVELFIVHVLGLDADRLWDWLAATPKGEEPDWNAMPDAVVATA